MPSCPPFASLLRLGHDSLDGSRLGAIDAHVQSCPACQGVLERLAADPTTRDGSLPDHLAGPGHPPAIPGFVIERELGRGGMGVVYQAWQPQLARRVAIKVVGGGLGVGTEERRSWLREAQAIARVRHRNVVPLHEVGERDGWLYLVLELIPGGSLADRVDGPLAARVAAGLVADVARAVEEVHRAGLLHLDIKPSNILLDGPPDGPWDQLTPMLTDFGIARPSDDPAATASGQLGMRGTPSYMAPEQIGGDRGEIGPRSDVFALGATLYRLLTGRPPFQGASAVETLDLVRQGEPAAPRTLVPGLPRDLETIALTCLRKEPRRRYASAEALADDLRRWLDGFPIRARPASKLEHAARWCRRRPAIAALLGTLALTVASSLVGLLALWRSAEAHRLNAEVALARAVENQEAAARMGRHLIGSLAMTDDASTMASGDRLEFSSRVMSELMARMRQDRGVDEASLLATRELVRQLSVEYFRRGKFDDSRRLFLELLGVLEEPGSRRVEGWQVEAERVRTRLNMAALAGRSGRFDLLMEDYERAEESLRGVALSTRRFAVIDWIDGARWDIAGLLGARGLAEPRRRVLEANIRMLEHQVEDPGADPRIGHLAALTRAELAGDFGAIAAALRPLIKDLPANAPFPGNLVDRVSAWIIGGIELGPAGVEIVGGTPPRSDAGSRAHAVVGIIQSRCKALGVRPSMIPIVSSKLGDLAASRGSELRNARRLEEARWSAACLAAIASELIRKDPGEPEYHLLMCMAREQEAKNAWKTEDFPVIEDRWRKALGEAHFASGLDPRHVGARAKVAAIQEKLTKFLRDHPPSR